MIDTDLSRFKDSSQTRTPEYKIPIQIQQKLRSPTSPDSHCYPDFNIKCIPIKNSSPTECESRNKLQNLISAHVPQK